MEAVVSLESDTVKSFVCPFRDCTKTFAKKSRLVHHVMTHTGERPYECPVSGCIKKYVRAAHLKRHMQSNHTEQPPLLENISCPTENCHSAFRSQYALKKHINTVHKEAPKYKCTYEGCSEAFRKKHQLRAHLYSHQGVLPFQCEHPDCKRKFTQKSHLERHKKIHKGYVCNVEGCPETFSKFSLLRKHRSQKHKQVRHCPDCKKTFSRPAALRYHSRIHSDNREVFQCPKLNCTRFYFNIRNLNAHIRLHHDGQTFICSHEDCGRAFSSKRRLLHHQKLHDPTQSKRKRTGHHNGGVKSSVITKITGVPVSALNKSRLDLLDKMGNNFKPSDDQHNRRSPTDDSSSISLVTEPVKTNNSASMSCTSMNVGPTLNDSDSVVEIIVNNGIIMSVTSNNDTIMSVMGSNNPLATSPNYKHAIVTNVDDDDEVASLTDINNIVTQSSNNNCRITFIKSDDIIQSPAYNNKASDTHISNNNDAILNASQSSISSDRIILDDRRLALESLHTVSIDQQISDNTCFDSIPEQIVRVGKHLVSECCVSKSR